jgi:leucyl aminopeptidase
MDIKVIAQTIQTTSADAILVDVPEGAATLTGAAGALDQALNGGIRELIQANDFRGKPNELAVLYTRGLLPAPRVIAVGLGKTGDVTPDRIRQAAAAGMKKARELGCKSVAASVFGTESGRVSADLMAQSLTEGALLGLYRWRVNHTDAVDRVDPVSLSIMADPAQVQAVEAGLRAGQAVAAGVNRARDLVNQAPNYLTPAGLAQAAEAMSKEAGVKCTIHDMEWIRDQKMNAFLAVGQGSVNPPKFIELEYTGSDAAPIVFVGKGITFDSGGISLKAADGMEDMRDDMGGAAAVIGAVEAIAKMKLPVHVVGLIAATENLPSGTAYRPADVIISRKGTTIEIISTDAEGRLTLADALDYAAEFKPQAVIDLATLTGACVIALGENVAAGYFCNDDSLAQKVEEASRDSAEKLWRLPLYVDYREKIKTDYADIKNTGGRMGGVGTSAVFLEEFASYPWAHWDIAGMVLDKLGAVPVYPLTHPSYIIRGATGFGVRALVSFAKNWK